MEYRATTPKAALLLIAHTPSGSLCTSFLFRFRSFRTLASPRSQSFQLQRQDGAVHSLVDRLPARVL